MLGSHKIFLFPFLFWLVRVYAMISFYLEIIDCGSKSTMYFLRLNQYSACVVSCPNGIVLLPILQKLTVLPGLTSFNTNKKQVVNIFSIFIKHRQNTASNIYLGSAISLIQLIKAQKQPLEFLLNQTTLDHQPILTFSFIEYKASFKIEKLSSIM